MRVGVAIFPGSNCDRDMITALQGLGAHVQPLWHKETTLPDGVDVVVLPGGFSYGDYLRCGALAARSPLMRAVKQHAARGGYVLGVCNGFQILAETGLLPGALMRNRGLKFICKTVRLQVESASPLFLRHYRDHQQIDLPIAHAEGNYVACEATLQSLEDHGQIALRYLTSAGHENPNGSAHDIAGVLNREKNVMGLMPHPERACDPLTGGIHGQALLRAFC
jgi:phosphoribosylformylglycinamidine synthase subunit PurQ / glutaminase